MSYALGPQRATRYNRQSVERALTVHFGEGGATGWMRTPDGGYTLSTAIGIVKCKTLREAALVVIGAAEATRRVERAQQQEVTT